MELMELLKTRRTYRRFDQSRPVPADVVEDIVRSAQYASSAANGQPLSYCVVQTPDMVEAVYEQVRWAAALPREQGWPKDGEHPVLFVAVLTDAKRSGGMTPCDAGLAISNMTLAAWNKGVGSCIMGAINRPEIMQILGINPEEKELHTVIAFGYPTHKSTIREIAKGEPVKYYLDENRDYVVPKYRLEDVVEYR